MGTKHTRGEWSAHHIDVMENVNGIAEPTGRKQRVIHAQWRDNLGLRHTQFLAELFEQPTSIEEGEANAKLMAGAAIMRDTISGTLRDIGDVLRAWDQPSSKEQLEAAENELWAALNKATL